MICSDDARALLFAGMSWFGSAQHAATSICTRWKQVSLREISRARRNSFDSAGVARHRCRTLDLFPNLRGSSTILHSRK